MTRNWQQRAEAAERTVDVLKASVRDLYDRGAQTAIHKQLARAQQRDEEQRRKRAIMAARNAELQRYSEELEGTVARRTAQLRAILDNVTFGFLVIDRECRVQPGFTRSCAELLGREVMPHDDICHLFGVEGTPTESMLRIGIDQVHEDLLPEDVSIGQVPSRFDIGDRKINADARVVRDEDDAVIGTLITLSDVTALIDAEERARRNAALVEILRQKAAFVRFVQDARMRLDGCRGGLQDTAMVRRAVHTIKGNAGCYGLVQVAKAAHEAEGNDVITGQHIDAIENSLREFLTDHESVLGVEFDAESAGLEVDERQLRDLRRLLDPLDESGLRSWSREVLQRPVRDLIGPIEVFVERVAERLDRAVDFRCEGADIMVDPDAMQPVLSNLTHLVRNAIDHGLEPSDQRGDKSPRGCLVARFGQTGDRWTIDIEDDGRGIDIDRLLVKVTELGLKSEAELAAMSRDDRMELIFLDGLSSKDEATDISGRGVGMSAVREVVYSSGGSVDVRSTPGVGTCVHLEIPKRPQAA